MTPDIRRLLGAPSVWARVYRLRIPDVCYIDRLLSLVMVPHGARSATAVCDWGGSRFVSGWVLIARRYSGVISINEYHSGHL